MSTAGLGTVTKPPASRAPAAVAGGRKSAKAAALSPPPVRPSPAAVGDGDVVEVPRQEHLQAAVGYVPAGTTQLTRTEAAVLKHVQSNYLVPPDFEVDKARYGPLSGLSYESRLLNAYRWDLLVLRPGKERTVLCARCGGGGHWPSDCQNADGAC